MSLVNLRSLIKIQVVENILVLTTSSASALYQNPNDDRVLVGFQQGVVRGYMRWICHFFPVGYMFLLMDSIIIVAKVSWLANRSFTHLKVVFCKALLICIIMCKERQGEILPILKDQLWGYLHGAIYKEIAPCSVWQCEILAQKTELIEIFSNKCCVCEIIVLPLQTFQQIKE